MPVFDRDVHSVTVKTPSRPRDSSTGASSLVYDPPAAERTVRGFLVTRGGTVDRGGEGEIVGFDAVFFTKDTGFAVDDLVIVSLEGLAGNFLVVGREPKYDLDGAFDHDEVLLSRTNTL